MGRSLNQALYSIVIVLTFFSFGTIGFFNLFGLGLVVKLIAITLSLVGIVSIFETINFKKNQLLVFGVFIFFLHFGLMKTYETGSYFNGLIQGIVMGVIAVFILCCNIHYIVNIATKISYFIIISSLLGICVFITYILYPSIYNPESANIMHSDIGNETIVAASLLDYLSFTSGDGFEFFGSQVTRVKGYCNEPSASIVHYVGPIGLMLFCRKIPTIFVLIPILFALVCVSSGIGIIAIIGLIPIFILFSIKNKQTILFMFIGIILLSAVALTYSNLIINNITIYGQDIYQQTANDLVSRKATSAQGRLASYDVGLSMIMQYPLGGSGYTTMTGLWVELGLVGGVISLIGYFVFLIYLFNNSVEAFNSTNSLRVKAGIALIGSLIITATLLSSYGWTRIPGVIILFLYVRLITTAITKNEQSNIKKYNV